MFEAWRMRQRAWNWVTQESERRRTRMQHALHNATRRLRDVLSALCESVWMCGGSLLVERSFRPTSDIRHWRAAFCAADRESLLPRLHSTCLSRQLPALFRFISRAPLYTSPIMRNKKKLTISVEHFASEKVFIGAKNLYRCRVWSALTRLYFPLSSHGARYQGEKTVIAHCCFGGFGGEQKWARS